MLTEVHGYGSQLTLAAILGSRLATKDIVGDESRTCFLPAALNELTADHRTRLAGNSSGIS